MDTQTFLHDLREEVTCAVCSEIFTDPRNLSCLHSFCLRCLIRWHQTSQSTTNRQDTISCPTCRSHSTVPESGDLNDLPNSFYLNGLIDVLAIRECGNTQVTCGNCNEQSPESSYCFQCGMLYCKECANAHKRMRSSRNHRALALREFKDKDYEEVLKRPAFCPKQRHQNEELRYYCKSCKMAACRECWSLQHSGHALEHIEDEVERQKVEIKTLVRTQRQNLQPKKDILRQIDEDCVKMFQESEDLMANIQTLAENLIAVIEAKKADLFAEVKLQTEKSFECLTRKRSEIENDIKMMESSLDKADKLITRGANAEIIQLKNSLDTISAKFVETTPVRDLESLSASIFVQNQKLLDTVTSEEMGSLEIPHRTKASQSIAEGKGLKEAFAGVESKFNLITRDYEKCTRYNENDLVTVGIEDEQKRDCKMGVEIHDNKTGQYEISYCPRDQGRYSITIKVNGQHVIGSPVDLLVKAREWDLSSANLSSVGKNSGGHSPSPSASRYFSPEQGACSQATCMSGTPLQFKPLFCFGKGGSCVGLFNHPWGVAVSNTDEIAVTDQRNHRVQIFNRGGNYLNSFGRYGTRQGEFNDPRGICFDNNGNIFVADNGNNRIQIFTREGRYMGDFGGKGDLDSQLSCPWGLSLDAKGNIIVTDKGKKPIKIFKPDGKFVSKIGGPGSLSFPVHCVQCDEYLIVSDAGEHCMKVFNRKGKFQYKFGGKGGGDGEFNYPSCFSVIKSKHLMVCDKNNHRIQVFELNGRFVFKFGTKGSHLGEFNCPMSVANLSNGRIVVCGWENNRIQVFDENCHLQPMRKL